MDWVLLHRIAMKGAWDVGARGEEAEDAAQDSMLYLLGFTGTMGNPPALAYLGGKHAAVSRWRKWGRRVIRLDDPKGVQAGTTTDLDKWENYEDALSELKQLHWERLSIDDTRFLVAYIFGEAERVNKNRIRAHRLRKRLRRPDGRRRAIQ